MKKSILTALALACLLLCACSPLPITEIPEDTCMSAAEILLEGDRIKEAYISTFSYANKTQRYYVQSERYGVKRTQEIGPKLDIGISDLTYGQFLRLLDDIKARLQQDAFGMTLIPQGDPEIEFAAAGYRSSSLIVAIPLGAEGNQVRYMGYYVYSLKDRTLTQGDHLMVGRDELGTLQVSNQWFGSDDYPVEYIYILLTD